MRVASRFGAGIFATTFVFAAMGGCSSASSTRTTAQDFESTTGTPYPGEAAQLVSDVWNSTDYDYLPWAYSPDGCFDRSYFLAMEFASRGIPVREQIINLRWNLDDATNKADFEPIDQTGARATYEGTPVEWQYHIAAVLMPGENVNVTEPTVIDRALEPGPVSVAKWVADANSRNIPVETGSDAPVTADEDGTVTRGFNEFKTYGAPYVGVGDFLFGNWESFESDPEMLPWFDVESIQLACNTLWTIWVDCMGADAAATTTMLENRVNSLIVNLDARGLADWDSTSPMTCGRNTNFSCGGHAVNKLTPSSAASN